jgi:hypothetical protein
VNWVLVSEIRPRVQAKICPLSGLKDGHVTNSSQPQYPCVVSWKLPLAPEWGQLTFFVWAFETYRGLGARVKYMQDTSHTLTISGLSMLPSALNCLHLSGVQQQRIPKRSNFHVIACNPLILGLIHVEKQLFPHLASDDIASACKQTLQPAAPGEST